MFGKIKHTNSNSNIVFNRHRVCDNEDTFEAKILRISIVIWILIRIGINLMYIFLYKYSGCEMYLADTCHTGYN